MPGCARSSGCPKNPRNFARQTDGTFTQLGSTLAEGCHGLTDNSLKIRYAETMTIQDAKTRGLRFVERIQGANGASRMIFEEEAAMTTREVTGACSR